MTATSEFHTRKVDELIKDDWLITHREIAVKIGISEECVGHIIDVCQYWKICARWILHMLTAEVKASGGEICQQLLSSFENAGEEFLHCIMTVN